MLPPIGLAWNRLPGLSAISYSRNKVKIVRTDVDKIRCDYRQGAAFAGLDMMRRCFQSLSEKEISLLFKKDVIQLHDLAVPFIKGKRPEFHVINGVKSAAKGMSRPDLMVKLSRALLNARLIEKAYRDIPAAADPAAVFQWEGRIRRIAGRGERIRP